MQNAIITAVNVNVTQTGTTLTATAVGAACQWIDCNTGNPIASETNVDFTPTDLAGDYVVIVTENGCSDTSNCYNIDYTGINDLSSEIEFVVFPNPSMTGLFTVSISSIDNENLDLNLYNVVGQNVYTSSLNIETGELEVVIIYQKTKVECTS